MNRAYRLAGLGVVPGRSPMLADLTPRITAFIRSAQTRTDFDWSLGEAIDCRFYRVTIARSGAHVHDRCTISFIDQTSRIQTERSMQREMTDALREEDEGRADIVVYTAREFLE